MVPKRDTRQQILTEAFLLYEDLSNSKFSLSELAGKVGISKTAIFRHFKNKDALIQAMTDTLYTSFASVINQKNYFFARSGSDDFSFEEFSDLIKTVLSFYIENRGYLGFTLNSGLAAKNSNKPLFNSLKENGINFSEEYIKSTDLKRFFRTYFCTESMIFFLARRTCLLREGSENIPSDEDFKNSIVDILWNGISLDRNQIPESRLAELDKISKVEIPQAGEDERFFMAFTEVFNEYGLEGITVERISEKLNLAKSSLYSYFNNKEEYITKMLSSELIVIMNMLSSRMEEADSVEEIAYILLQSEKNYLEQRPFVLTLHSWASQQGFNIERMSEGNRHNAEEKLSEIQNKGLQIKNDLSVKTFLGWVSSIIGTLKIYFSIPAKEVDYVNELFGLICSGVSKSF